MTRHSQGIVDSLDFGQVLERQQHAGVKLTFTVSTDVTGQNAERSTLALKNQLREAKTKLIDLGMREADAMQFLTPVSETLEDSSYWRLQSRGLAIFLAEDFFLAMRVPIELLDSLTVGEQFNLLPVAPVLATDRKLYVLALAQNAVRLFDSTRNVIEQVELENVPASFSEVIDELPEREIDVRAGSAGAQGTPSFHGTGGDMDRMLVEKYVHAVGQAIGTRLGTARSQLLVLAAVSEYLPIFKAACPYPAIFDGVIAGNPEHAQADELRSAAWHLVNAREEAHEATEEEHARSQAHAGKGSFDLAEIAKAAEEGRVDTLFLPRNRAETGQAETDALANRALIGTLKGSGVLRTLGTLGTLGTLESEGLATFRY